MPCHTQVREIRSPMKQSDKRVIGDFSYGPSELTLNLLSGGGGRYSPSLRSKRFRGVGKQRKTEERGLQCFPRAKKWRERARA